METLKVSSKMRKSIERLEKKYGKLTQDFNSESDSKNVYNHNFYCYCELTSSILKSLKFTVCHDGTVHSC